MGESTTSVLAKRPVSVQLRLLGVQSPLSERTPPQNGHLDLVPAFLYSLYLTLYKTDISLRRTLTAGPKGVRLRGSWLYSVSLSSEPSQSPCQSVCQRLKNHLSHVFTRLKREMKGWKYLRNWSGFKWLTYLKYFSDVIYRRVGWRNTTKNPHRNEFIQESFDMQWNVAFNS